MTTEDSGDKHELTVRHRPDGEVTFAGSLSQSSTEALVFSGSE